MMAVRYHRCTCHQRYNGGDTAPATYSAVSPEDKDLSYSKFVPCNAPAHNSYSANNGEVQQKKEDDEDESGSNGGGLAGGLRGATQPWYFHAVASGILIVHGLTFLVPSDPTSDEKDMVRTVAGWLGYDMDWIKVYIPYAQVN